MKAMIFAAGLGSRFKPWTDQHPKALVMVNGKSLLQRAIEYLQQFGIKDVLVNVHHFSAQIVEAIQWNRGWGSTITISDETEAVLETGGGLQKACWFFNRDPFVAINVDIMTDLDLSILMANHHQHRGLATLAVSTRPSSRYLVFAADGILVGWKDTRTGVEKGPFVSTMKGQDQVQYKAFSGIHIIEPRIFSLSTLRGKFSMIDLYLSVCTTESIYGFDHGPIKWIDVGKPTAVSEAALLFP